MLNLRDVEQLLAPSVPRRLRTVVQAATQTPVPERLGEDRDGAGQPEGGDGRFPSFGPSPLSGPPISERSQSAPVHPGLRHQLEDRHLVHLLNEWSATS